MLVQCLFGDGAASRDPAGAWLLSEQANLGDRAVGHAGPCIWYVPSLGPRALLGCRTAPAASLRGCVVPAGNLPGRAEQGSFCSGPRYLRLEEPSLLLGLILTQKTASSFCFFRLHSEQE